MKIYADAMSSEGSAKKTALYTAHQEWGGRMVDFAGWFMPVQYTSILEEHHAVRKTAGLFDISHMGEFFVSGHDSAKWLNRLLTNDIAKLEVSKGQYTLMLNEQGGVIDDLIVYRLTSETYFLVVNASKIEEDAAWLESKLVSGVTFQNKSDDFAAVALQGPNSSEVLKAAFSTLNELPKRNTIVSVQWKDSSLLIARTGYTGEDGFEIFIAASHARLLWEHLLGSGKEYGCVPAGLGARDTLRLEACLPLNGSDLSPLINPIEAGLEKFVSFAKPDLFPGRKTLERIRTEGSARKSVAFIMKGAGAPPRSHYAVYYGEQKVGEVTSGGVSPTLQKGIGMAMVDASASNPGTEIQIEIRGKFYPATVEPKPLYKRP